MFRKFQISNLLPNRYFPKIVVGCPWRHVELCHHPSIIIWLRLGRQFPLPSRFTWYVCLLESSGKELGIQIRMAWRYLVLNSTYRSQHVLEVLRSAPNEVVSHRAEFYCLERHVLTVPSFSMRSIIIELLVFTWRHKNENEKTIDPTEILLSQCIRAAEN